MVHIHSMSLYALYAYQFLPVPIYRSPFQTFLDKIIKDYYIFWGWSDDDNALDIIIRFSLKLEAIMFM